MNKVCVKRWLLLLEYATILMSPKHDTNNGEKKIMADRNAEIRDIYMEVANETKQELNNLMAANPGSDTPELQKQAADIYDRYETQYELAKHFDRKVQR